MHPLMDEISTIKLWLALMANHLERAKPPNEDPFGADMVGLFGPCSPVWRSPTLMFFSSLIATCTPLGDSLSATVAAPDDTEFFCRQ